MYAIRSYYVMNPELNGKPVLVGGTSGRGVVAACSYEARQYGIHSAMPMRMAQQLCPHAIVVKGNSSIYSKFSDTITEIISEQAPLYEKSSIDEFYIDVTGMDKFYGSYKCVITSYSIHYTKLYDTAKWV